MTSAVPLDASLLRSRPLAQLDGHADKESRGRVVVLGGSRAVPGAVLLAGLAALRAGAGKIQLAVPECLAVQLGVACPEAGVLALPQNDDGELRCEFDESIMNTLDRADVLIVGPGVMDEDCATRLSCHVLERIKSPTLVIDAYALTALRDHSDFLARHEGRTLLTPHLGEMAALSGATKEEVLAESAKFARAAARRFGSTTVLKGAKTYIAAAGGELYEHTLHNAGLATAGSGDVLAGILGGLIASGNDPVTASIWAVHAHAQCGRALAEKVGAVGFLSRELLAEIPSFLPRQRS